MKNLKWIIPLAVVFVAGVILSIVLPNIKKPEKKEYVEIVPVPTYELAKPTNLSVQSGILSWDEVENADYYLVLFGDEEFKVTTNSFELSNIKTDGLVSIKAIGSGIYIDSASSIGVFYRHKIDKEEVSKIQDELIIFLNETAKISTQNVLETAELLYLNGFDSDNIKPLLNNLKELILDNFELSGLNKIFTIQSILEHMIKVFRLDLAPFVKSFGIISVMKCYFQNKMENPTNLNLYLTTYFTEEEILNNYHTIISAFDEMDIISYQVMASVLNYLELLTSQMENVINLGGGFISSQTDMTSDMITLKNTFCKILIKALPNKDEFALFTSKLSILYQNIAPSYILNKLNPFDFVSLLKEIYNMNHRIISFIQSINEEDYKSMLQSLKAVINSIDFEALKENLSVFDINLLLNTIQETTKNLSNINYNQYLDATFLQSIDEILNGEDQEKAIKDLVDLFEITSFITYNLESEIDDSEIDYWINLVFEANNIEASDNLLNQFIDEFQAGHIKYNDINLGYLVFRLISDGVMVIDYSSLGNSLIQKMGITDEFKQEILTAIKPILDNVEAYKKMIESAKTIYQLINLLKDMQNAEYSQILKLIIQYKSLSNDFTVNIDFISAYSLYTTLKIKYAKFDYDYQDIFDNRGFEFDYMNFVKGSIIYVLSGKNADELEILVDECLDILSELPDYIDKYMPYVDLISNAVNDLKAHYEERNMDLVEDDIKHLYNIIKELYEQMKKDELLSKSNKIASSLVRMLTLITDLENIDDLVNYVQAVFNTSFMTMELFEGIENILEQLQNLKLNIPNN